MDEGDFSMPENGLDSIRVNGEFDSNKICESSGFQIKY
jgi:hypothetical protein